MSLQIYMSRNSRVIEQIVPSVISFHYTFFIGKPKMFQVIFTIVNCPEGLDNYIASTSRHVQILLLRIGSMKRL